MIGLCVPIGREIYRTKEGIVDHHYEFVISSCCINRSVISFICDPNLNRNATNYTDNHKHKDAVEIILHFINGNY